REEDPDILFIAEPGVKRRWITNNLQRIRNRTILIPPSPTPDAEEEEEDQVPKLIALVKSNLQPAIRNRSFWEERSILLELQLNKQTYLVNGLYGPTPCEDKWWQRWKREVYTPTSSCNPDHRISIGDLNLLLGQQEKSS